MTHFNRFFTQLMERATINQSELARQAGTTWPCLWKWSTKPIRPKLDTLYKVCVILAPYVGSTPQNLLIEANKALVEDFLADVDSGLILQDFMDGQNA